jgi:hypothetical protein
MNHALRSGGARENTPGSPWLVSARQKNLSFNAAKAVNQMTTLRSTHSTQRRTLSKASAVVQLSQP